MAPHPTPQAKPAIVFRLRKHGDYQRVYKASRKQFSKQMSFFFSRRSAETAARALDSEAPRVGLTVGKVMGKAVDRNRIKRRMRAAIRANLPLLQAPVDVILHPRRTVIDVDFAALTGEVAHVFRQVQRQAEKQPVPQAPGHGVMSHVQQTGLFPRAFFGLYRFVLSPILHAISPSQCKFLPTCSEYAFVAVSRHGVWHGAMLALHRLARCRPFAAGGFDPVPPRSGPVEESAPNPRASKPLHLS